MNRRGFLKLGLGAAVATVAAPLLVALPKPKGVITEGNANPAHGVIGDVERELERLWREYRVEPTVMYFTANHFKPDNCFAWPIHTKAAARHALAKLGCSSLNMKQKRNMRRRIYRRYPELRVRRLDRA